VGDVIRREDILEKANAAVPAGKQQAEYVAHCDYLSAWEEDKYTIAQANVELERERPHRSGTRQRPPGRQLRAEGPRRNRVHGRQSEAARLGRRQPDSVP
jgi:hypothetical protein